MEIKFVDNKPERPPVPPKEYKCKVCGEVSRDWWVEARLVPVSSAWCDRCRQRTADDIAEMLRMKDDE